MDITIWRKWNKKSERWEHNHIENGLSSNDTPQGHKSWKSGTWKKESGWLDNEHRIHIGDSA